MIKYSISRCIEELETIRDTYSAVRSFNERASVSERILSDTIKYLGNIRTIVRGVQISMMVSLTAMVMCAICLLFLV